MKRGDKKMARESSALAMEKLNSDRICRLEEKVDTLHITQAQKPSTEVDKTVDKLIWKRKRK